MIVGVSTESKLSCLVNGDAHRKGRVYPDEDLPILGIHFRMLVLVKSSPDVPQHFY